MEDIRMDKEKALHAYLNGTATAEEIKILKADSAYADLIEIAEATQSFEAPKFQEEDAFSHLTAKLEKKTKVRRLEPLAFFLRIAAAFALLLTGYLFLRDTTTTITTQIAEKQEIILPDGSKVNLNALSSMSYNVKDWENDRTLTLDGEAFFEVNKGKSFSVETSLGVVKVLGTQFNVYSRDKVFDITCYEGLVSVSFGDSLLELGAGSGLQIEDGKLVENHEVSRSMPNWIENESSFKNVSLSLVLEELKRQYPIKITTQNIVDKKFTGSFTHTDLSVALRSICDPLQVDFTIEGDEVTLHAKPNN